jgi:hypothetical protein
MLLWYIAALWSYFTCVVDTSVYIIHGTIFERSINIKFGVGLGQQNEKEKEEHGNGTESKESLAKKISLPLCIYKNATKGYKWAPGRVFIHKKCH